MGFDDEVQGIITAAAKKLLADTRAAIAALPSEHPIRKYLPESTHAGMVAQSLFPFVLVVANAREEHYAHRAWDPPGPGPRRLITVCVGRNPDTVRGLRFGGYGITATALRHGNAAHILAELARRTDTLADQIRDTTRKET